MASGKAVNGKVVRQQMTAVSTGKICRCSLYVYVEYDRPSEGITCTSGFTFGTVNPL